MLMAVIRVPRWFFRVIVGCVATVVGWLVTAAQTAYAQVTTSFSDGVLTVTGDGNDNTIDIYVSGNNIVVAADQQTPWTYAKNSVFGIRVFGNAGHDYINCNISDAHGTAVGYVDLYGGDGNDTIHGSNLSGFWTDIIDGEGGDDSLLGHNGDDLIFGGSGNDSIFGGNGDDWLYGESGHDCIRGDAGDDWIEGGAGNDSLAGGSGADTIQGGSGADRLYHRDEWGGTNEDGGIDRLWGNAIGVGGDVDDSYWASSDDHDWVNGTEL